MSMEMGSGGIEAQLAAAFQGSLQGVQDMQGVAQAVSQSLDISPELAQRFVEDLAAQVTTGLTFGTPQLNSDHDNDNPTPNIWGNYNDMIREIARQATIEVKDNMVAADGYTFEPGATTASSAQRMEHVVQGTGQIQASGPMDEAVKMINPEALAGAIIGALTSLQSEKLIDIQRMVTQSAA